MRDSGAGGSTRPAVIRGARYWRILAIDLIGAMIVALVLTAWAS